jgi:gamma-glutamylcysteine synthetase
MMLAAGWTWPAVMVAVALLVTLGFVAVAAISMTPAQRPGLSTPRLDGIEEELAAVRADLADIKESLAELDRLFKSVG